MSLDTLFKYKDITNLGMTCSEAKQAMKEKKPVVLNERVIEDREIMYNPNLVDLTTKLNHYGLEKNIGKLFYIEEVEKTFVRLNGLELNGNLKSTELVIPLTSIDSYEK